MTEPNDAGLDSSRFHETTLTISPRYSRSPFFEATLHDGCNAHHVSNHMLLPSRYGDGDVVEEYWHLLEHVTLWDVGVERVVEIRGPDAAAFTDTLTPRDLTTCDVGEGRYAPLVAADGGIVNDPVLLHVADDRFWLCLADSDAGLWARGVAHGSGYDVEIDHPDVHPVQIQGPKSKPLVGDLFGSAVRDLEYFHCTETDLDGIPVAVSRTGWSGELGYEVYLRDGSRGTELWERIMDAGEQYRIRPTPPNEIRRIEAGIFNYRGDMTIETNPFQLSGMERLVDLDQDGEFLGREALERVEREGVDRKLVGLEIDNEVEEPLSQPWAAAHDGEQVGRVTAAAWSPRLERTVGYVWVPIELADSGTELRLETPAGRTHAGSTAALPFQPSEAAGS